MSRTHSSGFLGHDSDMSPRGRPATGHRLVSIRTIIDIPLESGIVGRFHSFDGLEDGREHLAIGLGPAETAEVPLVRIHSECLTGDVFSSQRCDCGPQLREAMYRIHQHGGYLLYLRQEGRGIGLYEKLRAYQLQLDGADTYEANELLNYADDMRDYKVAAQMLTAIGVSEVKLITNNLAKVAQLSEFGVRVLERQATGVYLNPHNESYLRAKATRGRQLIIFGGQKRGNGEG